MAQGNHKWWSSLLEAGGHRFLNSVIYDEAVWDQNCVDTVEIIPILQQQHQKWSRVQHSSTQGNRWQDTNISCCIIYCIHLSLYFLDSCKNIKEVNDLQY